MTTIAARKPFDAFKILAIIGLLLLGFILTSIARLAYAPASSNTVLVPCRQCGQGCGCPRLGGATQCGCPR